MVGAGTGIPYQNSFACVPCPIELSGSNRESSMLLSVYALSGLLALDSFLLGIDILSQY